jgi:hypothetical protein
MVKQKPVELDYEVYELNSQQKNIFDIEDIS